MIGDWDCRFGIGIADWGLAIRIADWGWRLGLLIGPKSAVRNPNQQSPPVNPIDNLQSNRQSPIATP
jgi:hypothetical protein